MNGQIQRDDAVTTVNRGMNCRVGAALGAVGVVERIHFVIADGRMDSLMVLWMHVQIHDGDAVAAVNSLFVMCQHILASLCERSVEAVFIIVLINTNILLIFSMIYWIDRQGQDNGAVAIVWSADNALDNAVASIDGLQVETVLTVTFAQTDGVIQMGGAQRMHIEMQDNSAVT